MVSAARRQGRRRGRGGANLPSSSSGRAEPDRHSSCCGSWRSAEGFERTAKGRTKSRVSWEIGTRPERGGRRRGRGGRAHPETDATEAQGLAQRLFRGRVHFEGRKAAHRNTRALSEVDGEVQRGKCRRGRSEWGGSCEGSVGPWQVERLG